MFLAILNEMLNIYQNIRNNLKVEFKVIECFEDTVEDKMINI